MRPHRLVAPLLALACPFADPTVAQRRPGRAPTRTPDNGCALPFAGSDRKRVKLRRPGLDYRFNNGGRAISVTDWFAWVCPLDVEVPATQHDIPEDRPLPQERLQVKLRAFVLAVKRDPDNDLHVQVADAARPYRQTQVIVEIPPGAACCEGRSQLMELLRTDGGGARLVGNYIFRRPPLVEVTGYLLLDAAHIRRGSSDYCTESGGRGIRNRLTSSPVRGLWEIHPVISLLKVSR